MTCFFPSEARVSRKNLINSTRKPTVIRTNLDDSDFGTKSVHSLNKGPVKEKTLAEKRYDEVLKLQNI